MLDGIQVIKTKLSKHVQSMTIGALLFEDHSQLDVYGPLELLTGVNYCRRGAVNLHAISLESCGTGISPSPFTITDKLATDIDALDLLLIPGGPGVDGLLKSEQSLDMIWDLASRSTIVCSISQGHKLISGCPLWADRSVKSYRHESACHTWYRSVRPDNLKVLLTAAGVSAAMDMISHCVIGEIFGSKVQDRVNEMTEYEVSPVDTEHTVDDGFKPTNSLNLPPLPNFDPSHLQKERKRPLSIALVLYDSFEMMDTFGPLEMFLTANRMMGAELCTVTTLAEKEFVQSVAGPLFRVDDILSTTTEQFDVLFIPGGVGTLRELHNPIIAKFLRKHVPKTEVVLTVCTGSSILASTGLLDGLRATSNKLAFRTLTTFRPQVRWVKESRWVVEHIGKTKVYTSSGVSAGTDMALAALRDLYGEKLADAVATSVGYSSNKDAHRDLFAKSIPANSIGQQVSVFVQVVLLTAVYRGGLAFGFPMYSIAPMLAGL